MQCWWREDGGGQVGLVGIHTERGLGVMSSFRPV